MEFDKLKIGMTLKLDNQQFKLITYMYIYNVEGEKINYIDIHSLGGKRKRLELKISSTTRTWWNHTGLTFSHHKEGDYKKEILDIIFKSEGFIDEI